MVPQFFRDFTRHYRESEGSLFVHPSCMLAASSTIYRRQGWSIATSFSFFFGVTRMQRFELNISKC